MMIPLRYVKEQTKLNKTDFLAFYNKAVEKSSQPHIDMVQTRELFTSHFGGQEALWDKL